MNKKTGQKVRTERQQIPLGQSVYRDPATGRVCLKANAKDNKDCPVELDPAHNQPMTAGERAGYHGAIGLTNKADQYGNSAKKGGELLTDPAKLSTAALEAEDRAEQAAKSAVETLKDPHRAKEAARAAWNGTIDTAQGAWEAAKGWWNKPAEQKMDDIAEAGGGAILSVPADIATGAAVGGVVRTGEKALELAEDAAKAKKAVDVIEHSVPATSHAALRRAQAAAGDVHREVGDVNRVLREAKRYRDTESGHIVHVKGDRVVITNESGSQVTQFKNSRANTQQRVLKGKWEPIEE